MQNVTNYRISIENVKLSAFENIQLSVIVMYYVYKSFYQQANGCEKQDITVRKLSMQLNLSERIMNFVIANLCESGLLAVDGSGPQELLIPKINPETVKIKDIVNAVIMNKRRPLLSDARADLDEKLRDTLNILNDRDFILNQSLAELIITK